MRRVLSILPIVVIMALVATPVVMADPGGGGGGVLRAPRHTSIDLSSRAALNRYLSSIGVNPADAVVQRGLRNYAGPNCPGKGWTCTDTSSPVVQMSSGNGDNGNGNNIFVCQPHGAGTNPATNTCVIVQSSTTGTNRATCIEHNEQPEGSVSQSCSITQTSTSGRNFATVAQSIRMEAVGTSQEGSQNSQIAQASTSGANQANTIQHISLTAEDEAGPNPLGIEQTQEGHQDADVLQTSATGNNTSFLNQSIVEKAEAENGASITQRQNTEPDGPNSDAEVSQNSSLTNGGRNVSWLNQVNILIGDAEKAVFASQHQGSATGGLEGTVDQNSSRPSQSFNREVERQILDATEVVALDQIQIDPKRCCTTQQDNPNNVFDIDQVAVQEAGDDAEQVAVAEGTCNTSGNCTVDQSHTQNGQTETNSCAPEGSEDTCEEVLITCNVSGEGVPCPEESPIE